MKRSDAIALQEAIESRLSSLADKDLQISQALTGKLRVQIGESFLTFDHKTGEICYLHFTGFYSDLEEIKRAIKKIIKEHPHTLERLLWSYNHCTELEDDDE